jgi:DNA/RNA endonuclease YhcR with UshA esterase domain
VSSTCLSSTAYFVLDLILGSAITIYGLVSSYSGNYSVTIDNITTSFSALSSYNDSNALLFFLTDLSQDVSHTLVLTNTQNSTFGLSVGGMNVTTFGPATLTVSVAFFFRVLVQIG